MFKKLLVSVLASLSAVVFAAVTTVTTPGTWDLYKGTAKQSTVATEAACIAAAQGLNATATYTCRTSTGVATTLVPVDVCPNIAGVQATVPAGMVIDTSGNCVTPVDVCPNIVGVQQTVPSGMIIDATGNCVTPPAPTWTRIAEEDAAFTLAAPATVRYGIPGKYVQKDLLAGTFTCNNVLFTDPAPGSWKYCDKASVAPVPVDVCPNIDGVQTAIPVGMIKDGSGNCVTPIDPNLPPGVIAYTGTLPAGYTQCAAENGTCVGIGSVIYGYNTSWRIKNVTTSTPCTNAVFGDPLPYYGKTCYLAPTNPPPPPPPVDVCPNIAGVQTAVPTGMVIDVSGNCVAAPPPPSGSFTYVGGVEPGIVSGAGLVGGSAFNVDFGVVVGGVASGYSAQMSCNGVAQGVPVTFASVITGSLTAPLGCSGMLLSVDVFATSATGVSETINVPGVVVK